MSNDCYFIMILLKKLRWMLLIEIQPKPFVCICRISRVEALIFRDRYPETKVWKVLPVLKRVCKRLSLGVPPKSSGKIFNYENETVRKMCIFACNFPSSSVSSVSRRYKLKWSREWFFISCKSYNNIHTSIFFTLHRCYCCKTTICST